MNLLFVTFDTLRSDHLGCYGYDRATSPNIDALASRGGVFLNSFAQGNCTQPGFTSMFTGLYPESHTIVSHWGLVDLPEAIPMLAERMKDAGYLTAAVDNLHDLWQSRTRRYPWFRRAYDHYLYPGRDPEAGVGFRMAKAQEVTEHALAWLGEHGQEKWYLFVHYWDPHAGYNPPAEHDVFHDGSRAEQCQNLFIPPDEVNAITSRYDGEIHYADHEFGRVLDFLEEKDVLADTLVVFNSDHGEIMAEPRFFKGRADRFCHRDLHDDCLRVPLIVAGPSVPAGLRPGTVAQHVDIVPTIIELLDLEPGGLEFDGRSLAPWLAAEAADEETPPRPVFFSENTYQRKRGILQGKWKLIENLDPRRIDLPPKELYDLEADPLEACNVAAGHPDVTADLSQALERFVSEKVALRGHPADPLVSQEIGDVTKDG